MKFQESQIRQFKRMALDYPPNIDERRLSTIAALNSCVPNNAHREQDFAINTAANALLPGQPAERGFRSGTFCPPYSGGHHWTHVTPCYPSQTHDIVPVEQTRLSPSFAAALPFGNPLTNFQGAQPYDSSIEQGTPTYVVPQHGQHNTNGYKNGGYADFSSGPFQPTLPFSRPGTVSNPSDTSVRNAKPYSCTFACGKSFARKGDMERHARIHLPPGLWCKCGKGFTRKDKLMEHQRSHQAHQ